MKTNDCFLNHLQKFSLLTNLIISSWFPAVKQVKSHQRPEGRCSTQINQLSLFSVVLFMSILLCFEPSTIIQPQMVLWRLCSSVTCSRVQPAQVHAGGPLISPSGPPQASPAWMHLAGCPPGLMENGTLLIKFTASIQTVCHFRNKLWRSYSSLRLKVERLRQHLCAAGSVCLPLGPRS